MICDEGPAAARRRSEEKVSAQPVRANPGEAVALLPLSATKVTYGGFRYDWQGVFMSGVQTRRQG